MQAGSYAARAHLRPLVSPYASWTRQPDAQAGGMSLGWVKTWLKRLPEAPPQDEAVLQGQSPTRKHAAERISQRVVERLLELRDQPPEGWGRTPGPKALLSASFARCGPAGQWGAPAAFESDHLWPLATGPTPSSAPAAPAGADGASGPQEPVATGRALAASPVPAQLEGKRGHVVEGLKTVARGTSVLVQAQGRADFNAQTPFAGGGYLVAHSRSPKASALRPRCALCQQSARQRFSFGEARAFVTAWPWRSASAIPTIGSRRAKFRALLAARKKNAWQCSTRRRWNRCRP
jgi:hypothetical protein